MSRGGPLAPRPVPAPPHRWKEGGVRVGVTTVPDQATARRLAQAAVQQGLAACVQIESIESVYVWDGQVAQDAEWRLSFKCPTDGFEALTAWLHREHPYELPQWYGWEPCAVSGPYAGWVKDSCEAGVAGRDGQSDPVGTKEQTDGP